MFTGIVEELGKVKNITQRQGVRLLEINAKQTLAGTQIGDSISVNGVCLTVVAVTPDAYSFEVMQQTLKNTNLGSLQIGGRVNLERSLKVSDRVSGHFVYGHIDCLGIVRRKTLRNGVFEFEIAVAQDFMRYCLPKGSLALDGISLTLGQIKGNLFTVYIIPHTLKNTTLGFSSPSDKLNVEFDMLAKRAAV